MIYLDNSATTRPSGGVIRAMTQTLSEGFYNPSSMYAPALEAEKKLNECRAEIAGALHAKDASVIFTSGGTESNNLAIAGTLAVSRAPIRVAVSAVEHPSVYEAAKELCAGRAEFIELPVETDGRVSLEAVEKELKKGLALLSVMQVNNETGAINDISRISRLRMEHCPDCRLHADGVQGFLREEIRFDTVDMYSLSAHKLHASKGTGALVVKKGLRLKAVNIGGGQEGGLRSGTENTAGVAGLKQAIGEMRGMADRREKMTALKARLYALLKESIPDCVLNGPAPEDGACHILNMSFPGVRGETMLHALEEQGVIVSTGSACSSKKTKISRVLSAMGVPARIAECAIRFSLCPYNTEEEIVLAAQAVKKSYETLVRFQRR